MGGRTPRGCPPIVVHRCAPTGGRAVTINGAIGGRAHDDRDLIDFLRRAGIHDTEHLLDAPHWIERRGGRAHRYEAA
ncbi:hypothetical protein ACWD7C_06220 [Streptomyces sp. NPDC005134]|uniref:hypothetical protein n=1 Tax=unclassified Streptomyces TaxID=2593676 RepID=UPI0033B854FD